MKRILAILLLISGVAYGQVNNTTNTNFVNGLGASKFFNIPRGTTPPTTGVLAGSLFYHTTLGLQYYTGSSWETVGVSGAGVTSFNSRTGAVTPLVGDYSAFFTQLDGTGATGTWGIGITGNAGTVTNGVYTNGSYSNPNWLTDLSLEKVTGLRQFVNSEYSPSLNAYYWTKAIDITTDHRRDGAKLGVLGKYLFLFGGWHPDSVPITDNEVYRFNSAVTGTTKLSNAPWAGRHSFGLETVEDTVYVFGGDKISGYYQTDSWKGVLSADTINWTLLKSNEPLLERVLFASLRLNGYTYIIGGQKGHSAAEGGCADVVRTADGITYTQIATGLTQFAKNLSGAGVSFGGYMWIIGGGVYDTPTTAGTFENKVWRSVDGITWEQMPDAPWTGRQYMDCTVYDGKVFMVGGVTGGTTPADNSGEVWSMDINGNWEQMPDGLTPRHATAVASYKNMLVASCGNYWNDTYTLSKYKASASNMGNTIVVRDSLGFIYSDVYNASASGNGGYVIGRTALKPNGEAFWYHSGDTTLLGSYKHLALYAGTGSPTPNPNMILESTGNVRFNRITTDGPLGTTGGNGTAVTLSGISVPGEGNFGSGIQSGTHDGADFLCVERYSSGYPYAVIQAGKQDNNVSVGISLQPRNSSGDSIDGVTVTENKITAFVDLEITTSGTGLILKDTGDGSRRRITVVNGVLTVSSPL